MDCENCENCENILSGKCYGCVKRLRDDIIAKDDYILEVEKQRDELAGSHVRLWLSVAEETIANLCTAHKEKEKLLVENERLREDVRRCGENWKAVYKELKIKLKKITEVWNAEIKDKEDSVYVGEIHYRLPKQALSSVQPAPKEANVGKEVQQSG